MAALKRPTGQLASSAQGQQRPTPKLHRTGAKPRLKSPPLDPAPTDKRLFARLKKGLRRRLGLGIGLSLGGFVAGLLMPWPPFGLLCFGLSLMASVFLVAKERRRVRSFAEIRGIAAEQTLRRHALVESGLTALAGLGALLLGPIGVVPGVLLIGFGAARATVLSRGHRQL